MQPEDDLSDTDSIGGASSGIKVQWEWDDTVKGDPRNEPQKEEVDESDISTVLVPAIDKLIGNRKGKGDVIAALETLKQAFGEAEARKPGITGKFLNQIIETLKSQISYIRCKQLNMC